jgi:hypothetical protein
MTIQFNPIIYFKVLHQEPNSQLRIERSTSKNNVQQ